MSSLLIATLVAAPQWTADVQLKPNPMEGVELSAADAPSGVVVLPPRRKAHMSVTGPGTLRVRAWGLVKKKVAKKLAKKLANSSQPDAGKLRIWLGTVQRKTLPLSGKAQEGWSVTGKPRWRVGAEQQLELPIAPGTHEVTILHQPKRGAVGFGLLVEILTDETEPAATVAAGPETAEPAAAEPEIPEPEIPQPEIPEPEIPEPELPADDGPALVLSPTAMVVEPGIDVTLPDTRHTVTGPHGAHQFRRVQIDPGMVVTTNGPGTVVLDLHAHRAQAQPETLEPVVLGILLDDVLVETVSLATPASNDYSVPGAADFQLSTRVAVRIPVPIGEHKLQLSLSDNAVLGASVRPRFLEVGEKEPEMLDLSTAREGDLVAGETTGGLLIGATAGVWLPNVFREAGAGAMLEGSFAIPMGMSRLLISLIGGIGYHDASRQIEDPAVASGQGRVRITQTTVPLLLGAAWDAAMPVDGLTAELGLGGGAVLNWTTTRYRKVDGDSMAVSPAMAAWGGAAYGVGPGALVLRVTVVAALPYSEAHVNDFDPGAVLVCTGYRFDFDS